MNTNIMDTWLVARFVARLKRYRLRFAATTFLGPALVTRSIIIFRQIHNKKFLC